MAVGEGDGRAWRCPLLGERRNWPPCEWVDVTTDLRVLLQRVKTQEAGECGVELGLTPEAHRQELLKREAMLWPPMERGPAGVWVRLPGV